MAVAVRWLKGFMVISCPVARFSMISTIKAPVTPIRVKALAFQTMICLRSSPERTIDMSMPISNAIKNSNSSTKNYNHQILRHKNPPFKTSNSFYIFSIILLCYYVKYFLHFCLYHFSPSYAMMKIVIKFLVRISVASGFSYTSSNRSGKKEAAYGNFFSPDTKF